MDLSKEYEQFTTKNHKKSKGLNISLKYPKGWIKIEGRRPNIIYNVRSNDNINSINILVKDISNKFPKDIQVEIKNLDNKEINELLNYIYPDQINCEEYSMELGFDEVKDTVCKRTKIEGLETSIVLLKGSAERANLKMNTYNITYSIYYDLKLIMVNFSFLELEDNSINTSEAELFANLVMNTFILNNLWE